MSISPVVIKVCVVITLSMLDIFMYYTPPNFDPIIIPPVYEVYRGYIVFAFSVIMFVCLSVCLSVCKLFFLSKISQQLLDLGLWNLVQSLVVMSCTV